MKKSLYLIIISCLTAICSYAQQADTTSTLYQEAKAAIAKGNEQWAQGWKNADAAMVSSIFAPDGVQLSQSGNVIAGPTQIFERQKKAMQGVDPGVKVVIKTQRIWLVDSTAYETGRYTYEYSQQGKAGKDEGRYVTIWKRQNGTWKLVMDMGFPDN